MKSNKKQIKINSEKNILNLNKIEEKFTLHQKIPRIVILSILFGIGIGFLMLMLKVELDKILVFQYVQFLLIVCMLGLLIDTRSLIKNCARK